MRTCPKYLRTLCIPWRCVRGFPIRRRGPLKWWLSHAFRDKTPVAASVLIPLVMREELMVLLTQRTAHLSSHSGQIAFPGGKADLSDTDAAHTALREAQEEIGLASHHIEVIGSLPVYTTGSAFIVTPVVGLVAPHASIAMNADEVADVFEVPLAYLMGPGPSSTPRL